MRDGIQLHSFPGERALTEHMKVFRASLQSQLTDGLLEEARKSLALIAGTSGTNHSSSQYHGLYHPHTHDGGKYRILFHKTAGNKEIDAHESNTILVEHILLLHLFPMITNEVLEAVSNRRALSSCDTNLCKQVQQRDAWFHKMASVFNDNTHSKRQSSFG